MDTDRDSSEQLALQVHLIDRFCDLFKVVAKWGTIAWCAYQVPESLSAVAGQDTNLTVLTDFFGGSAPGITVSFSLTVTFGSTVWAWRERKLHYNKVEYFQERIRKLEQREDPDRTTSGLTPQGKTNPNDE